MGKNIIFVLKNNFSLFLRKSHFMPGWMFKNRFKGIPCFWTAKGGGEFFPNSFKLNRVHRYADMYIFHTFHIYFIHFHTLHTFFWSYNTEINNPTSNSRSPFEIVSSKKAAGEAEKEKDG